MGSRAPLNRAFFAQSEIFLRALTLTHCFFLSFTQTDTMKFLKYGGMGLLLVLLLIQLYPYGRDHNNPPVQASVAWDSPETEALFGRACADCHSHETVWPWYSHVAPVSWLVQNDVEEGREQFNISLPAGQQGEAEEAAEKVQEGEMPLKVYLPTHPEARLSKEEQARLVAGLEATFAASGH